MPNHPTFDTSRPSAWARSPPAIGGLVLARRCRERRLCHALRHIGAAGSTGLEQIPIPLLIPLINLGSPVPSDSRARLYDTIQIEGTTCLPFAVCYRHQCAVRRAGRNVVGKHPADDTAGALRWRRRFPHERHTSIAGARPVLGREEMDHLIEDQNRVCDPPIALI
jgi:hypothetical protein